MTKKLNLNSVYAGTSIILTTKHAKSIAIAPPFKNKLGASIRENVIDTDLLGTFAGELERKDTALECARKKCELGFVNADQKVEFALASEGSFGPHRLIPFLPCNQEILYFIDRQREFHLHVSYVSEKTNYRMAALDSLEALEKFAHIAKFPSHALIVRAHQTAYKAPIFKGITSKQILQDAFRACQQITTEGKVWVETDMRALFNPSRMSVIRTLATKLAERLATHCPSCNMPGWGKIRLEKGLLCSWCDAETELVKLEVFGCVTCNYEETTKRSDGMEKAEPKNCQYCNP